MLLCFWRATSRVREPAIPSSSTAACISWESPRSSSRSRTGPRAARTECRGTLETTSACHSGQEARAMKQDDLRDEALYLRTRADELAWHRAHALGVSRRRFLQLAASAAALAAADTLGRAGNGSQAAPADLIVKPTPPEWVYDFASNKEMRWENIAGR